MIEGAHLEKGVLNWGLPRGVFHWLSREIHEHRINVADLQELRILRTKQSLQHAEYIYLE